MSTPKLSRAESLARAHAANRRKRLEKLASELRENGFFVVPPEGIPTNAEWIKHLDLCDAA
jgi:hypothetical protein